MPRRTLSRRRKLAYSLLAAGLGLALIEGVLALCGVRPIVATEDPFVGFASQLPLFVDETDTDGRRWMTTSENKLPYFNAQRFLAQKPAGTYRIFCLGGSTTYGRPYNDAASFPGWLRELLPVVSPDRTWEVVNAGGISYASYRAAALMEELVQYEPDLFIVYTGHNEFLERRTYGDLRSESSVWLNLNATLAKTRTYAVAHRLLKSREPAPRDELPGEVDAVLDHTVGPSSYHRDDSTRQQVLAHFEFNLARMVRLARSAGAKVMLVSPAANLKDCSPFKSQHAAGLDADQQREWTARFQQAVELQTAGQLESALQSADAALALDSRHAQSHYLRGRLLLELGRAAEAAEALRLARDEDVCPLRALSEISAAVDRAGRRMDVPRVDFPLLLQNACLRRLGHNIPGREFFLDHVHPTIEAHQMLALAIIEKLRSIGVVPVGRELSEADLAGVIDRVEARIDPEAHAVALRNLAKVLNWAGKHEEAGRLALEAVETLPDDPESLVLAAAALKSAGNVDGAINHYRRALAHSPRYAEAHQLLGAALVETQEYAEALQHFQAVLQLKPDDVQAQHMTGAVLAELGRFDESLVYYQRALKLAPRDPQVHYNLAFALAKLGRAEEAISQYRQTVALNPQDGEARYNLALLLLDAGHQEEAISQLRQALRHRPNDAAIREELEKLLKASKSSRHTDCACCIGRHRPVVQAALIDSGFPGMV